MTKNLLFVMIIALYGCVNIDKTKPDTERILVNIDKTIGLCFSDISLIPLETTAESLFSDPYKVTITEERIYILINMPISAIYVYSKDGTFLNKINNYGKGPGEFLLLEDFFIDERSDRIDVYDMGNQKNILFNLNGDFISEWKHNLYFSNFFKRDGFYFISAEYNTNVIHKKVYNNNLLIVDEDINVLKTECEFNIKQSDYLSYSQYNNFYLYNENLNFIHALCDTIYLIQNDFNLKPRYVVDFGRLNLPQEVFKKDYDNVMEFSKDLKKTNYAYHINTLRETDANIMFNFKHKNDLYLTVYSKEKKISICGKEIILDFDDFKIKQRITPQMSVYYIDGNELVFFIEPVILKGWLKAVSKTNKDLITSNSDLIRFILDLENNENPVLMRCKIENL